MADSTKTKEGTYVCTLCPESIKKAEDELNEKAETRSSCIQSLREMVKEKKDLHVRIDDAYLLRFLRARKFDKERAFNLIKTHFEMKLQNKDIFDNLRPSAVKHVLEDGVTGVLPNRDKNGRRVMLFRPGRWDPARYGIDDVFRTNFMTMSKLIEEEETQVNGIILMMDMGDMGWNHAKNISPSLARRVMSLIQDAFPARFKGIHYLNEPSIFDYIFAIVRQFMKEKTVSRLHFHGDKYEELQQFIDKENLPEDYGGTGPKYTNTDWKDKLLSCDAEFDEEAKYGLLDGSQNAKGGKKEDAIGGIVGSYRKLNV